jgi:hypothetical protein
LYCRSYKEEACNKKVKAVVQIENDLETLHVALQQAQQHAKPETDGIIVRIMVLKGTYYFPRGKYKGGPKEPSWSKHERPPLQYEITKERLQATLLLPRMAAAASLGIKGSSIFTRVHHELGVQDWPTRNEVLTTSLKKVGLNTLAPPTRPCYQKRV